MFSNNMYLDRRENRTVMCGVNPNGDAAEQQTSCTAFKSTHRSVQGRTGGTQRRSALLLDRKI